MNKTVFVRKEMSAGIFFCLLFLLTAQKIFAQDISLAVSPPLLEVMIKPGKSITQVYKITNNGETVVVVPKIVELGPNGIEENSSFVLENWIGLISSDVQLNRPFVLAGGKTKELILKINPSDTTPEADYYRVIIFATTPSPPEENSQSQVSAAVGSPLLITTTKTGLVNKNAKVAEFEIPTIIDSFGPLEATVSVANTGTTYTRPVGAITLSGGLGKGKYDIIPRIILSGQRRVLTTDQSPEGSEGPTLVLPGFYFGPYELSVNFTLDQGTKTVSQTRKFYAVPWKFLLILLLLGLLKLVLKKRKKKVMVLFSYFLLTLLFISVSKYSPVFGIEQKRSSQIQGNIPIRMTLHVFGYTAPYSIIQAQGIRVFAQTTSDRVGYFDFPQLPLSFETNDVCFTTIDAQRRVGFPLCIKAPLENEGTDIGPILLSPTISLSTGIIWENQQAAVVGQTIPDSHVVISFFEANPPSVVQKTTHALQRFLPHRAYAAEIPALTGTSDAKGYYSVNLPTIKSAAFRVFTKANYLGSPSPKSTTLIFSVGSLFYYGLIYLFPKLFLLVLLLLITSYTIHEERKTRRLRLWAIYFNETRLIPFEIRARLTSRRIWYTLRGLWK